MEGEKELGQKLSSRWEHTQVLPYNRFFGTLDVMSFVTTPEFNDGGCKVRGGWFGKCVGSGNSGYMWRVFALILLIRFSLKAFGDLHKLYSI